MKFEAESRAENKVKLVRFKWFQTIIPTIVVAVKNPLKIFFGREVALISENIEQSHVRKFHTLFKLNTL